MSHTSSVFVYDGEFCWHGYASMFCQSLCVFKREYEKHMETLTVLLSPLTPPLPQHTHSRKCFLCDQWRAHTCPLHWIKSNMHSLRPKTWKKHISFTREHSHIHFFSTGTCIVLSLGTQQWEVLLWQALQGFNVSLSEVLSMWKLGFTCRSLWI